ncbi:MAG: T9SS type A sorting domain-containing protein [Saprospiraceae bacterium]
MKKILFLLCFVLMSTINLLAQCVPNQQYKDSTFGVYPKPYQAQTNPNGGIKESACIGKPYKTVLTAKVPDSIAVPQLGGLRIPMDSIKLDKKSATTVQGLPVGLSYACNPPNCVFAAKSLGCVTVFGTASSANAAGDFDIKIELTAYATTFLGPFSTKITYPDPGLAPGKYTIKLEGATSTTCFVSDVNEKSENVINISASPNPTNDFTAIKFYALEASDFDFVVSNVAGKIVHKENRNVNQGLNTMQFDASALEAGIYIYYVGNAKGKAAGRLVVAN